MSEVLDALVKILLAAAGAGGLGAAVKYVAFPSERRKLNAQADSVVVGGSKDALALMKESVDFAKGEIAELRAAHQVDQVELKELRAGRESDHDRIAELEHERELDRRRIVALEAALRDAKIPIPDVI